MKERVLVTGGAGFIGSHIVEELIEKKYNVAILDNLSTGSLTNLPEEDVIFYKADIIDEIRVNEIIEEFQPNFIIHQAAQVSVAKSVENMVQDAQINIQGSLHIIDAARKNNVEKIVFASSAAVYGNPRYLPVNETHEIKPLSPYGLSKYTIEQYLEVASSLYGLDYTVLRYSNVYGPRQDAQGEGGVVAIFHDLLSKGMSPTIFGDGQQTRDFVYVKDVARANVLALNHHINEPVNISTKTEISIKTLLTIMKEKYGFTKKEKYATARVGDIYNSILSNDKGKQRLNWQANYNLDKGLQEMYDLTLQNTN